MLKIYSALMLAKAPDHFPLPGYAPFVSDLETEKAQLFSEQMATDREVLFPPRILVMEDSKDALDEQQLLLVAKHCPGRGGWTEQQVMFDDISEEWKGHFERKASLREAPPDYTSELFVIGVIGYTYNAGTVKRILANGADVAETKEIAYAQFRNKCVCFLEEHEWIGGLAQIHAVTPTNFFTTMRDWRIKVANTFYTSARHITRVTH